MARARWTAGATLAACSTLGLTGLLGFSALGPGRAGAMPEPARLQPIRIALAPVAVSAPRLTPQQAYYEDLRERLHWVPVRLGGKAQGLTLDEPSRVLLARSAARRAGLAEFGLGFREVYGLINAESSWVPRQGASRDGTPNLGIAQFEPATAQALGVDDPDDPVEAVHAAALFMREAAQWSRERIAGLQLTPRERALRLREGISVYYNLSWRGRESWNGRNTDELPVETRRHIENTRLGAQEAARIEARLRGTGEAGSVLAAREDGWQS